MRRGVFAALAAASLCAAAAGAASAAAVTVTPVGAAALKRAIAAHRGHVVLVNFWATWCIPCVQEFPGLVQLSDQYKSKGLVVLAVSGDKPRDIKAKIGPFLTSRHATFPQYVIQGDLDTFVNGFQPKWQADFPQTFVYDRRGRLVREMTGAQTVGTWQAAVVPLLGQGEGH